ncbi:MAG: sugar kinase [Acidobacteria bacterium]|nr:sugar kinase [Acidobacteriota bacterium]
MGTMKKNASVDLARLVEIVESFARQTIAVVGDLVADEFVSGDISRVSREAPVLILRHQQTEFLPGGGANAANNLADLGAKVIPVGVVGDDPAGRTMIEYFRRKGVDTSRILTLKGWTTTTKIRFLAGWAHTTRQQVLRVDREPTGPVPERAQAQMLKQAKAAVAKAGAVIYSDYGCGAVTPDLAATVRGELAFLDSRYAMLSYSGSRMTAATPNEGELESVFNTKIGHDLAALDRLGNKLLRHMKLTALLVTRGRDGLALFERGQKPLHLPVHGGTEAVDVTGAGDTVIAVFALALASSASYAEAARLANYGGGIVVMKRGTATVSREELLGAIHSDMTHTPSDSPR